MDIDIPPATKRGPEPLFTPFSLASCASASAASSPPFPSSCAEAPRTEYPPPSSCASRVLLSSCSASSFSRWLPSSRRSASTGTSGLRSPSSFCSSFFSPSPPSDDSVAASAGLCRGREASSHFASATPFASSRAHAADGERPLAHHASSRPSQFSALAREPRIPPGVFKQHRHPLFQPANRLASSTGVHAPAPHSAGARGDAPVSAFLQSWETRDWGTSRRAPVGTPARGFTGERSAEIATVSCAYPRGGEEFFDAREEAEEELNLATVPSAEKGGWVSSEARCWRTPVGDGASSAAEGAVRVREESVSVEAQAHLRFLLSGSTQPAATAHGEGRAGEGTWVKREPEGEDGDERRLGRQAFISLLEEENRKPGHKGAYLPDVSSSARFLEERGEAKIENSVPPAFAAAGNEPCTEAKALRIHAKSQRTQELLTDVRRRAQAIARDAHKPLDAYRAYTISLQEKLQLVKERERQAKTLTEGLAQRRELLQSRLKVPPPPPLPLVPVRWNRETPMHCDDEELVAAQALLRCSDPNAVLIDKFNIGLTAGQLECLYGSNWLNDEVINFYMQMLQERNEKQRALGQKIWKIFFFNTFFYAKLTGGNSADVTYDYASVKRWTKRQNVDIFAVDLVLVPLHVNRLHWTLGVVDMRQEKRKIYFFDSLGGKNKTWFLTMRRYLQDEHLDKRGKPLEDVEEWFVPEDFSSEKYTPQQENGFDCGVFICQMAECITDGRSFDFSQKNIPQIRAKMALQIVSGELNP
ncbi:Ulp1 protease family, C-terminal catalytic domain-containing protein [Besnoitia besnoiti]|uniref:Ulp1 protease family, C-terminal catalytic domain-containing protein n=1 Tax=Besnoitia besnoiti TaxID=94643 RepID=A0A2A9MF09_BESBE|nr:Ulp1 protease family, C-terminal catalytic domain-containing protein [Besnoitia besnoiti]PFH37098.1 Ulp1 protease family, C-terminal catalytic domain-containing protein [Besnoitia besnoiti]